LTGDLIYNFTANSVFFSSSLLKLFFLASKDTLDTPFLKDTGGFKFEETVSHHEYFVYRSIYFHPNIMLFLCIEVSKENIFTRGAISWLFYGATRLATISNNPIDQ
jgi:hypothetical protein